MLSITQTDLFNDVKKELNYPFGNVFVFDGYVVSEINEGVTFSWDNYGKEIAEDIAQILGTDGRDIIYISHRINSYSVVPLDWIKFFRNAYGLKAYCIVSKHKLGFMSYMVENLFFNGKIKRFGSIYDAVNWVKNDMVEIQ